LIINKTDLAPHVGADLSVMAADAKRGRGEKPFVMTDLLRSAGVQDVMDFVIRLGGLSERAPA
jgi:urease accessory protein